MRTVASTLAPGVPSDVAREVVRDASTLILVFTLLALVVIGAVAVLLARRRAQVRRETYSQRPVDSLDLDAWREAARRVPLDSGEDVAREPGTE